MIILIFLNPEWAKLILKDSLYGSRRILESSMKKSLEELINGIEELETYLIEV